MENASGVKRKYKENKQNHNMTNRLVRLSAAALATLLLATSLTLANPATVHADPEHSAFARAGETSTSKNVAKYGMTPISGEYVKDGTWTIDVNSSSKFFRIHSAELIVKDHQMTARLTMETYSYPLLCMSTAEDAAAAPATDYIDYEDIDDWAVFTIPVKGLNTPIDCAAFSKKKKKWYSRQILFDASSLDPEALDGINLPDYDIIEGALQQAGLDPANRELTEEEKKEFLTNGNAAGILPSGNSSSGTSSSVTTAGNASTDFNYEELDTDDPFYAEATDVDLKDGRYSVNVALTGGSGRSSVSTPTLMIVEDGKAYVELLWSSPHYDWMRVGGVTYTNEAPEGSNSVFTVPIPEFDAVIPVVADTTAMGDPVAIQYSLTFYEESIGDEALIPQLAAKKVVIFAVIIIVVGFFLNMFVKKRRKA